eukprot:8281588-Pyramimonas_sp.AAC.1
MAGLAARVAAAAVGVSQPFFYSISRCIFEVLVQLHAAVLPLGILALALDHLHVVRVNGLANLWLELLGRVREHRHRDEKGSVGGFVGSLDFCFGLLA